MDLKTLASAVEQIAAEKGIASDKVIGAIEAAIAAAYKREYRKRGEVVRAEFDMESGEVKFWQVKTVVDPEEVRIVEEDEEEEKEKKEVHEEDEEKLPRYNEDRHIFLEEARKEKSDAEAGEEILFPLESHSDFGRIAAQTAKQVILQSIREAERASIQKEFAGKEGEIVSGVVQRFERGNVYIDLGRAVGIMFRNESIPGEHYRIGQRMRFYVLAVQDDPKRPGIILSRANPKFVVKLFELEIPEMAENIVEIKSIAREAGSRTKIAVASNQEGVDPVGSAVGQRGMRVIAVTNELGMEKIDIVEWSEETEKYIGNSLSPAKTKLVEVYPRREARVFVPEDQLSLAIGKGGQNVRLAAKLTGWKIDVRSQSEPEKVQEGGVATAEGEMEEAPKDSSEEVASEEKPKASEEVVSETENSEEEPPVGDSSEEKEPEEENVEEEKKENQ